MEPFDATALDRRDPDLIARVLPLFELLNATWFRLDVRGVANIGRGPALYAGNHNGGIMGPDLTCTLATLWRNLGPEERLYAMAHDFAMSHVTPLGRVLQKLGATRATADNAARALASGGSVLVYPGGDLDAYRHFRARNRIVFGKRAGFVRVAQRARVPIVPVVAYGAHRSAVIFHEGEWLAKKLGLTRWSRLHRFPLALSLPWIIGAGPWVPYLPLPFKIRLRILEPISVSPSDDADVVRDEVVRAMQKAMDEMVEEAA